MASKEMASAKIPTPSYKPPKTLAACADRLYEVRERRLALERQAEVFAKEEAALREHLINNLPKSDASGIAGKLARVTIQTKDIPRAVDWSKLHAWCLAEHAKHKRKGDGLEFAAFDIFQRRLSDGVVKERWERGEDIPGVEVFTAKVVSCVKV